MLTTKTQKIQRLKFVRKGLPFLGRLCIFANFVESAIAPKSCGMFNHTTIS